MSLTNTDLMAVFGAAVWPELVGYTSGLLAIITCMADGVSAAPSGDSGCGNYFSSAELVDFFLVDATAAELMHGDWVYVDPDV